jgi:hypothetical protein
LFTKCLITFAIVEGIFFGSFSVIFWFKQCGVLPDLYFANELISCDEAFHCDFACVLYNCSLKPPCSIHIREIVDIAIQIEECFICEVLLFNLLGMNATLQIHPILCWSPPSRAEINLTSTMLPTPFHGWILFLSKAKQTLMNSSKVIELSIESHRQNRTLDFVEHSKEWNLLDANQENRRRCQFSIFCPCVDTVDPDGEWEIRRTVTLWTNQ